MCAMRIAVVALALLAAACGPTVEHFEGKMGICDDPDSVGFGWSDGAPFDVLIEHADADTIYFTIDQGGTGDPAEARLSYIFESPTVEGDHVHGALAGHTDGNTTIPSHSIDLDLSDDGATGTFVESYQEDGIDHPYVLTCEIKASRVD